MATRTLQFYGIAYGSEPVTITADFNGAEIFNSTISTINGPVNTTDPWNDTYAMFTAEINSNLITNIPFSFSVSGNGTAIISRIDANYLYEPNPIYSTADYDILMNTNSSTTLVAETMDKYANPPFTPTEMALVESTNPGDTVARRALLESKNLQPFVATGANVYNPVQTTLSCWDNTTINSTPVTTSDPRCLGGQSNPSTGQPYVLVNWEIASGSTFAGEVELPILVNIPPHLLATINASLPQ